MGRSLNPSPDHTTVMMKPKYCRHCRGTGVDPDTHHRYTVDGSHDDRRCPECNGDGVIEEMPDAEEAMEDTELENDES